MRIRTAPARLAAAVTLILAAVAAGTLPAHASGAAPQDEPPARPYRLTLQTDPASTDYGHRTVDLSGTLTSTADGSPAPGHAVVLTEDVVFETWNPWQDPIDPAEYETRTLGTITTDRNGRFEIPDALVDHVGDTSLARVVHFVYLNAQFDPDGNPNTNDDAYASIQLQAAPVPTTLTYHLDRTRVHTGDTLTVTGNVNWPAGHGSLAGTEVFLRAYWEAESNARTTTDASGNFTIRYKVGDIDEDFALFTAPRDYYLAGTEIPLPVHHPVTIDYNAVSATVDVNGRATVKARINQNCASPQKAVLALQFAKQGTTAWKTVGSAVADSGGAVQAAYTGGNGSYRWTHAETDYCGAGTSPARAVYRVQTRIAGFHGTPHVARKGRPLRMNGTLQFLDGNHVWQNRGRHPIQIWYRPTSFDAWRLTAVVQSSTKGAFQKTAPALTTGWWKAVAVSTDTTYTAVSPYDWIRVVR
ncbi:hypothetical protein [Streptomyces sp. CA-111067]|uniref:hypothetical protein n=1 Tax=Streptomyces sp. CA-111067 TaxID=3240046 RepID=UPI003D98E9B1